MLLLVLADSKRLFDVIILCRDITDLRLMVSIAAVRKAYYQQTISKITPVHRK